MTKANYFGFLFITNSNDEIIATINKTKWGYILKSGAFINPDVKDYVDKCVPERRNDYAFRVDKTTNTTTKDICFNAPSAVAAFVLGRPSTPYDLYLPDGTCFGDLKNR